MITLNLQELINFYDRKVEGSQGHATALNALLGEDIALAAFRHYLNGCGAELNVLSRTCTRVGGGARLDAWLEVKWCDSEPEIFQTEIKNWSSHSYRGRRTPKVETEVSMKQHRINRWLNQFDVDERVLKDKDAKKVLYPMQPLPSITTRKIAALIIFWDPMHKDGSSEPFFRTNVASEHFEQLSVFSISNHFRNLIEQGTNMLEVKMDDAEARLKWLGKIAM